MRLVVDNISTRCIIGGRDNLLPFDVSKELYNYFSVKRPGAFFSKKKRWDDGMQHFYSKQGYIATGFLPMLISYAMELGVPIDEIEDNRKNMPVFKPAEERDWTINDKLNARDNQTSSVEAYENYLDYGNGRLFYFPRGISDIATNGGKTSIIYGLIKNVVDARALIVIDSEELQMQLYEFLSRDFDVGLIRGGKKPLYQIRQVTIAMVKTLNNHIKKSINVEHDLATKFNMKIIDECHKAGGKEYSDVIMKADTGMACFLSGTALKSSNNLTKMVIVGLSGAVLTKISKKELMDAGISLPIKVTMHLNRTYLPNCYTYQETAELAIYKNVLRTEIIGDIIDQRPDKKIIINFEYEAHGYFMFDYITKHYGFDKMAITHGKDPDRKQKLADFKAGLIEILLSSRILSTGIDIADISVLINAKGGMSEIELSQWAGRIERNDGVSDHVELHDFYDEARYVDVHSRKRIKFYQDEKFEISYDYEHKRNKPI